MVFGVEVDDAGATTHPGFRECTTNDRLEVVLTRADTHADEQARDLDGQLHGGLRELGLGALGGCVELLERGLHGLHALLSRLAEPVFKALPVGRLELLLA